MAVAALKPYLLCDQLRWLRCSIGFSTNLEDTSSFHQICSDPPNYKESPLELEQVLYERLDASLHFSDWNQCCRGANAQCEAQSASKVLCLGSVRHNCFFFFNLKDYEIIDQIRKSWITLPRQSKIPNDNEQ